MFHLWKRLVDCPLRHYTITNWMIWNKQSPCVSVNQSYNMRALGNRLNRSNTKSIFLIYASSVVFIHTFKAVQWQKAAYDFSLSTADRATTAALYRAPCVQQVLPLGRRRCPHLQLNTGMKEWELDTGSQVRCLVGMLLSSTSRMDGQRQDSSVLQKFSVGKKDKLHRKTKLWPP